MKRTGNSGTSGGRWSSPGKSAQVRSPPPPVEINTPAPPQSLSERIPTMSDVELASLLGNARRVAAEPANKKAESAAELIPLIEAEQAKRVISKAEAGVVRKKDMATARATAKARKLATAAAESAGKLDASDDDEEVEDADGDEAEDEDEEEERDEA